MIELVTRPDNFKVKVIDEDTVDRIDTGANHHPSPPSSYPSAEEEFPPIFRDQVHKSPVGQSNTGKHSLLSFVEEKCVALKQSAAQRSLKYINLII